MTFTMTVTIENQKLPSEMKKENQNNNVMMPQTKHASTAFSSPPRNCNRTVCNMQRKRKYSRSRHSCYLYNIYFFMTRGQTDIMT